MARYSLKGKHSEWTDKGRQLYGVGDVIELSDAQAASATFRDRIVKLDVAEAPTAVAKPKEEKKAPQK